MDLGHHELGRSTTVRGEALGLLDGGRREIQPRHRGSQPRQRDRVASDVALQMHSGEPTDVSKPRQVEANDVRQVGGMGREIRQVDESVKRPAQALARPTGQGSQPRRPPPHHLPALASLTPVRSQSSPPVPRLRRVHPLADALLPGALTSACRGGPSARGGDDVVVEPEDVPRVVAGFHHLEPFVRGLGVCQAHPRLRRVH